MTSIVPFKFNNVQLFSVTVDDKVWIRAHEVSDALDYKKGRNRDALKKHVSIENKLHRFELEGRAKSARPFKWPKNSQPDEYYINEEGMYELLFKSQQPKAKEFRRYCCNEMFPKIRNQLLYQRLEEKNAQLALLNDDLAESQDLVKQLEYNNTGLQGEIRAKDQEIERRIDENADLIANRHVPRRNGIDNVLVVIEKNEPNEEGKEGMFPYYIIRSKKSHLAILISNLRQKYPLMEVKEPQIEDANAIHRWNRFKEDYLQKDDYFRNHFTLLNGDAIEQFEKVFGIDMT